MCAVVFLPIICFWRTVVVCVCFHSFDCDWDSEANEILCVQSFSCLLFISDRVFCFLFKFIRLWLWDWERSEILCLRSFSCLLSICDRSFLFVFVFLRLTLILRAEWDFVCADAFLPIIHFWHTFVVCIRPPLVVTETDREPSKILCTQSFSYYPFLTGLCCVRPPSAIKLRLNQCFLCVFFVFVFKYVYI